MHVHSSASALSKLGVQRSLGIPECATEPAEAYELAKRRGMDFVTLTDHDTIDGALELADLPDTFIIVSINGGRTGTAPVAAGLAEVSVQLQPGATLNGHLASGPVDQFRVEFPAALILRKEPLTVCRCTESVPANQHRTRLFGLEQPQ